MLLRCAKSSLTAQKLSLCRESAKGVVKLFNTSRGFTSGQSERVHGGAAFTRVRDVLRKVSRAASVALRSERLTYTVLCWLDLARRPLRELKVAPGSSIFAACGAFQALCNTTTERRRVCD